MVDIFKEYHKTRRAVKKENVEILRKNKEKRGPGSPDRVMDMVFFTDPSPA